MLDAHKAYVQNDCACSTEAADAVSNTSESEAINQSAAATAEAANEGTATVTTPAENGSGPDALDAAVDDVAESAGQDKQKAWNWLETLAMGLSDVQSRFLDRAMEASKTMRDESAKMDGNSDTKSENFLEAQAVYSATMQ